MLYELQQTSENWRKHWLVFNVVFEIPIIGSFFKKKTLARSMHDAGKCVAAIAGGTTAMMTILVPAQTDDMATHIAKMTTSMIVGMTVGKVIYNGFCNGGPILYQYFRDKTYSRFAILNDQVEIEAIPAHSEPIERSSTALHS